MTDHEYNEKIYTKYARKERYQQAFIFVGGMAILVLVYLLLLDGITYLGRREVPHCADLKNRVTAQALYLSNPVKYGYLDANHDGIACNNLPI